MKTFRMYSIYFVNQKLVKGKNVPLEVTAAIILFAEKKPNLNKELQYLHAEAKA